MKMAKFISLCSTLAFVGLASACHQESTSTLDIIRGQPLAPDSPALNNVVGLSLNGLSTFCTGSVVAEDIVVTAAHCVGGLKSFYVVFGPPNRIMQKIEVVQVETFKPYGEAAFPNFDIAWLKLKTKVPAGFKPLEVLRDPALLKKAKEFRLAGYGFEKTNCFTNDCSDELLEAKTALDKYHDNARLMSLLVFKGAAELGFGGACNGDSGGPAYAKIDDRWYLIGVTNGTTAYMTPEAHANSAQSCEAGSDIYTFMGDYVPWIQKRSTQQLIQRPETNPDRTESPFVIKGEVKPDQAPEPSTWAEWIQYPYHNEQVWNTIDRLLWQILELRRPELPAEELIKIWGDGPFSQDQVESITDLDFQLNSTETLRYQDQPLDLRPLGTWTGLKTLRMTEEAAAIGIESISRLTSLRSLTLVAPATLRERALDLKALQKLGSNLETLSLTNFTPAELQTVPFQAFTQLT
ncbi:MAG: trypsin-like serine protease, partial [Pseudobdellovibrionaceae bacterium]|nr:trypsin-like serine protease [Pseudobdellovibrionaceae bacterium]